jgi:hypothetical protein
MSHRRQQAPFLFRHKLSALTICLSLAAAVVLLVSHLKQAAAVVLAVCARLRVN